MKTTTVRGKRLLFRKKAVEHSLSKFEGSVLLLPRMSYVVFTLFFLIWFFLALFWLATNSYSRKETVRGWLEPISGVIKAYSTVSDSFVKKVFVAEGEFVESGDSLVQLQSYKTMINGEELNDELVKALSKQKQLVNEQIQRLERDYPKKEAHLDSRLMAAQSDLDGLNQQLAVLEDFEFLMKEEALRIQSLYRKSMASKSAVSLANREWLAAKSNTLSMVREIKQQRSVMETVGNDIRLLEFDHMDALSNLKRHLGDIEQQLLQSASQANTLIKATVSGHVDGIQVVKGQKISRMTPILSVIPENSDLMVKLLVPVRAVGFLEEGLSIDVRYDAFPYQKFGSHKATVLKVSQTALLPDEVVGRKTKLDEAVYIVDAKLDAKSVTGFGKEIRLRPGTTLSANIYLDSRSILEWLLEPIFSLQGGIR